MSAELVLINIVFRSVAREIDLISNPKPFFTNSPNLKFKIYL